MAAPTPSPEQLQAIQDLKAVADAGVQGAIDAKAGFEIAKEKLEDADGYSQSLFDYYGDDVIRQYELERRYIDGQIVAAPVTQTDLDEFVAMNDLGRLWNGGDYSPLRIPEFDGLPLAGTDSENETDLFNLQDVPLDYLVNGVSGLVTTLIGATIAASIDSASTSVLIAGGPSINPGDKLLVRGTNDSAIVEAVTFAASVLTFTYIIPPFGTLASASPIGADDFIGFTDADRIAKTATDLWEQGLMDTLLADLQDKFDRRRAVLVLELAAIQANGNDDIDANAEINVNTSIAAIDGFLGLAPPSTIDISDAGIVIINTEKTTRQAQYGTRITDIASEISTGDFYNLRYFQAEARTKLNNGTLAQIDQVNKAIAGADSGAIQAQALSDSYAAMLP